MRRVLLLITILLCGRAEAARPNIVFILADDLGFGDLSCYGAKKISTPNMDRLAKEGRRFTDAHSPHSVCTPTRYALLTGRYGWRTWAQSRGVWSNDPLLIDTRRMTLPKLLKAAGYKTACIGKWHLGFGSTTSHGWDDAKGPDYNGKLKPGPLEVGFDSFFGVPHVGQLPHIYIRNYRIVGLDPKDPLVIGLDPRTANRTSYRERFPFPPAHKFTGGAAAKYEQEEVMIRLTDEARTWLRQQKPDQPFFLYFATRNVHGPLRPHPRFKGRSGIGVYGDFILELDWSVGEILNTLDELDLSADTLVMLSSDNGAVQAGHRPTEFVNHRGHRANGPWRGQKTEAYEGGHRVPLLARWPGRITPGSSSEQLVGLNDVMATVAELLDQKVAADEGPDSISFLAALLGRPAKKPVRTSLVHDSNRGHFALREGSWKLITIQGGGGIGWQPTINPDLPPGQLYDLSSDPTESHNRYQDRPEIVRRLTENLLRIRR